MNKIAQNLFMIVTTSESILGICCNGFIWLVNSISLVKSKKMSLSEFVFTSLAISRISLLWLILSNVLILFKNDLQETSTGIIIRAWLWTFANFLSITLATCLSILYCLKTANFSHHVFLWLKQRVSHVVRWILLASVLFSFFSTFTLIQEFKDTLNNTEMAPTANCTQDIRKKNSYFSEYILITSLMIMPFFLSFISLALILLSLRRHTQQMQNNGTGSRDPSTEAHIRATKIILSFLFLFIMNFVAFVFIVWGFIWPDCNMVWMAGEMILAIHPSIHSVILILGNNKLKQVFLGMFQIKK